MIYALLFISANAMMKAYKKDSEYEKEVYGYGGKSN